MKGWKNDKTIIHFKVEKVIFSFLKKTAVMIQSRTEDITMRIKTIEMGSKLCNAIAVNTKEVPQKSMAMPRIK